MHQPLMFQKILKNWLHIFFHYICFPEHKEREGYPIILEHHSMEVSYHGSVYVCRNVNISHDMNLIDVIFLTKNRTFVS